MMHSTLIRNFYLIRLLVLLCIYYLDFYVLISMLEIIHHHHHRMLLKFFNSLIEISFLEESFLILLPSNSHINTCSSPNPFRCFLVWNLIYIPSYHSLQFDFCMCPMFELSAGSFIFLHLVQTIGIPNFNL
jgi:hypothetical protein